ncbi:peptidoglycan-binding protein [Glycomyces algeriensis]|uniref:Peptidoglycan-binding protein n=1 Tax=Glycomyces algeriensis TaxID=256037 RepID=A0A9W6G5E6_9ACTN|nr:peptidoglycan-binding protein [Glycomyces algeriensis]MDA1367630.1 peptidoglycan-binding domain-containing protein [Glycomyces algeriensis]MDR7352970.1 peptidoglycan hydrolase-like protein with peptidoglycan-binding domain [Glycomyces algeriensis]GLI40659.1 peptidoglycan-binding protein [Glycomyces algeriensis]
MTRKRRKGGAGKAVAVTAVVVAAAGAAAAALGFDPRAFFDEAEAGASQETPATAEVVQQTLTETVTVSGDLGFGDVIGLDCLKSGTFTALPKAGDVIERGGELFAVDDEPVTLLYGTLPAYRSLTPGAEGSDVKQFEENLSKLGYDGFTVDDEYTDATAEAVEEWQEDLGLPETGVIDLGQIAYAPGEVRVDTVGVELGDPVQPGSPVLDYTGLDKVVTVEVELEDQELVTVGEAVAITLPDGTEATGTIADSESLVSEEESQSGTESVTYLEVTVAADDPAVFDGLDQAAVDVGFAGETADDVLTVPVEALLGLGGGGYGLEIANGDTTEVIAVDTGLFADGSVEVSGEGLEAGMSVVVPS